MLLGTLGASLLGNLLTGRGAIAMRQGRNINKKGKGIIRAGEGTTKSTRRGQGIVRVGYGCPSSSASHNKKGQKNKKKGFLIPPNPLTNFEIQKYYQNKLKFNGAYLRDNLPVKIKDGTYIINPDEYSNIGTHWVALYVYNDDVTYFDSFGVEHIPK